MEDIETTFKQLLLKKYETNQKYLIPKLKYNEIVEEIKATARMPTGISKKTNNQYRLLAK